MLSRIVDAPHAAVMTITHIEINSLPLIIQIIGSRNAIVEVASCYACSIDGLKCGGSANRATRIAAQPIFAAFFSKRMTTWQINDSLVTIKFLKAHGAKIYRIDFHVEC